MAILTIDHVIDSCKRRNDARLHNWEEIRKQCDTKQYDRVLHRLRNMVDDCDFNEAFEIVCRYVASKL